MKNVDEAVERLKMNNPRLEADRAELIAKYGVEEHPQGGFKWRWDPRMNLVWGSFHSPEMERIWPMNPI